MKRLILAIALFLSFIGLAQAETLNLSESLKNLPALNQGIGFSVIDNKINFLSTIEAVKFFGIGSLEVGYAGDAEQTGNKIVGVASVKLVDLGDYVKFPILNLIEFRPGIYAGFGSINAQRIFESEFDWGVSATVISLKF